MITYTGIHGVELVRIKDTEKLECNGRAFYTRKITITTKEGEVDIIMFSDVASNLAVECEAKGKWGI